MRALRILGRGISNAGKSLVRNFSLTFASIICTIITLILVSIGLLLSYNLREITNNIEKELTIVIFMDKKATEEQIAEMKSNLIKVENVADAKYISKDSVKEEFKTDDRWADIIGTLDAEDNPFQDAFEVTVKNIRDINETVTTIKNMDNIDKIKYGESSVNDLVKVFDGVKTGTIVLVAGLVLVTTVLITNTIKITIFSRRKEIDIMRLVGTSNSVIKLPYLIEGLLIGLIGSIIPVLFTIFGYTLLYNEVSTFKISSIIGAISLASPSGIIYTASLFLVILGSGVGMIASALAVRKYLKV